MDPQPLQPDRPRPPQGPRQRAAILAARGLVRLVLVLLSLPLILALILPFLVIGHEITAPSWIARRIETQAARALAGGSIEFGEIDVVVGPDLHPRITLRDTGFRDAEGRLLARMPRIDLGVSPRGLILAREVLVQDVTLHGVQLALDRRADGQVALSFDQAGRAPDPDAAPDLAPASGPAGMAAGLPVLIARIEAIFDRPALAALERVRVENVILNYRDRRAGLTWVVDGGRVALDRTAGGFALSGDLSLLSGRGDVATLALDVDRPAAGAPTAIGLTLTDVAAADIATQSPALAWLAPVEARMSLSLRARIAPDGRPEPVSASLRVGAGVLRPAPDVPGLPFQALAAYLRYDPAAGRVVFDDIEIETDWGRANGSGQALLSADGPSLSAPLVVQLSFRNIALNPRGAYDQPLRLSGAMASFRLTPAPFALDLAELVVTDRQPEALTARFPAAGAAPVPPPDPGPPARLTARGAVSAGPQGWRVALDATVDSIPVPRVLRIWPAGILPGTRAWFVANIEGGRLEDVTAALRLTPGAPPALGLSQHFSGAAIRVLPRMPPITGAAGRMAWDGRRFVLHLDRGQTTPPLGGVLDLAGSDFVIPLTGIPDPPAEIDLAAAGSITALLSLLDQPPLTLMTRTGRPPDLARGDVRARARIRLPLGGSVPEGALRYDATALLTDVRTDAIIPGRDLSADSLQVTASNDGLRIEGAARLSGVPLRAVWDRPLGPGRTGSSVTADLDLSPAALAAFGIAVPGLGGSAPGRLVVRLAETGPPEFEVTSALTGATLAIPALGWRKPAGASGVLEMAGILGDRPAITALRLETAGLVARGRLSLRAGGGMDRLTLDRLALSDWLDVTGALIGRGPDRPPQIALTGGTLDLRRATFGQDGGDGAGAGGAPPMTIALDRVTVTGGIALTALDARFDEGPGLSGRFRARMNGGAAVTGTLAPVAGRVGLRLFSDTAGEVIRDAGLVSNATGGRLDLTLLPQGPPGTYDGTLRIEALRVRDAPALASMLDAISVVGLLNQMDGQGLAFEEVRADITMTPDRIAVRRANAVGPGLGISLDGYYTPATREMDFQGVISPFYILNGIGAFLTRPGEGLIGFAYTLTGPPGAVRIDINPLSVLTPGMFREIFRRAPPGQE